MALIVLDTSVLIAFLDPSDAHHARARQSLQAADVIDEEWVVPTTVCAELLVGAHIAGDEAVATIDSFIDEGIDRIEPMTLPIARLAARIRAGYPRLGLADAFVLATGEVLGAEVILTSDRSWRRVSQMVRVV